MNDKFDRQGNPIGLKEWAAKLGDVEYKRVGSDTVGPVWVSTVWLGLDHGFGGSAPLIFETMTFPSGTDTSQEWRDLYMHRYSTEEDAKLGHALLVEKLGQIFATPNLTPGDVRALLDGESSP